MPDGKTIYIRNNLKNELILLDKEINRSMEKLKVFEEFFAFEKDKDDLKSLITLLNKSKKQMSKINERIWNTDHSYIFRLKGE
jgi:hypothetical protein